VRFTALSSALALAVASVSRLASAESAGGVELSVAPACDRVDVRQLVRLLDIEAKRRTDASHARVAVDCPNDIVTLRVEVAGDGVLARAREFALRDVTGDVGARVLSLAAIELLDEAARAPKPVPARPVEPEPAPPPLPPPLEPTPSAPRFVPSVRLMAAGALQSIGGDRPLAGGGISVDYLRLAPLGLRLQVDLALGERSYQLGTASLRLTTLSAQAGYLALHDTWTARALVGYRFGTGRITGVGAADERVQEGSVAGAYGGPLLSTGLGWRAGSFVTELALEAGLVSFPLYGQIDGKDEIALDRYWLGVSINAGALL
jgi:hypothetical protein